MARPSGLLQWQQTVSTYLPHLSQPQLTVLVLWSFGIVLAQACGLTTVAVTLAYVLGCPEMTIREQLRDWYRDAQHKSGAKRGRKRRSLEVTPVLPLCSAGSWPGPTPPAVNSRWLWTPRRWGNASPSSRSAWWSAAVPSLWPGACRGHACRRLAPPLGSPLWPLRPSENERVIRGKL